MRHNILQGEIVRGHGRLEETAETALMSSNTPKRINLQGCPSGRGKQFVDIQSKVLPHNKLLVLKQTSYSIVLKRLSLTRWTTLYPLRGKEKSSGSMTLFPKCATISKSTQPRFASRWVTLYSTVLLQREIAYRVDLFQSQVPRYNRFIL